MRNLMAVCGEINAQIDRAKNALVIRKVGMVLASGAICLTSQAFAQDQPRADVHKEVRVESAHAAETVIPECMEKLKLTDEQQVKAKEIISSYDQKLDSVWKQFGSKYMATIRTECLLLAAIEDGLTEPQRTAVHTQRRQIAHAEKGLEGTNTKTNQSKDKPADAIEQVVEGNGVTLTAEQEAAADMVQQNYASHLRSLNRDIEGLHNRLVSLEADKLVELEKVLTKVQLTQLRESRQKTSGAPKITAIEKPARISE